MASAEEEDITFMAMKWDAERKVEFTLHCITDEGGL